MLISSLSINISNPAFIFVIYVNVPLSERIWRSILPISWLDPVQFARIANNIEDLSTECLIIYSMQLIMFMNTKAKQLLFLYVQILFVPGASGMPNGIYKY